MKDELEEDAAQLKREIEEITAEIEYEVEDQQRFDGSGVASATCAQTLVLAANIAEMPDFTGNLGMRAQRGLLTLALAPGPIK